MSKFEIHLTFNRPVTEVEGWKSSKIDGDPVLGKGVKFYLTTYAGSKDKALARIAAAKFTLRNNGEVDFIIREKIEEIVHDVIYESP